MKKAFIVKQSDCQIFDVSIRHTENKQFLSMTDMDRAYEKVRHQYYWKSRPISNFIKNAKIKIALYDILIHKGVINLDLNDYYFQINKLGTIKFLKDLGIYKTTGRGDSKNTYAIDWLWKLFFQFKFIEISVKDIPEFIAEIPTYIEVNTMCMSRNKSMENAFIDNFLNSCSLISSYVEKQFNFRGYVYDLKVNLLDMHYVLEYHEKQHLKPNVIKNDYKKFLALEDDYYYIPVPFNKEKEQMKYIKEIIENNYSVEMVNYIEEFRFKDYNDKISILINEKVLGSHSEGIRNMASSYELKEIVRLREFVDKAIEMNFLKSEEMIIDFILN